MKITADEVFEVLVDHGVPEKTAMKALESKDCLKLALRVLTDKKEGEIKADMMQADASIVQKQMIQDAPKGKNPKSRAASGLLIGGELDRG